MGEQPDEERIPGKLVKLALAAVFVTVLFIADGSGWMTSICGNLLVQIARVLNLNVTMSEGVLNWSGVPISWTNQCSGVSALFVLIGVTTWTALNDFPLRFAAKLAACVPLAVAANLLRVGLICAFRGLLFPHWEGITFHYGFGLLSLAPFVLIIARKQLRDADFGVSVLIYLSSILAVCSARLGDPGGAFVLLSTFGYLVPAFSRDPFLVRCNPVFATLWIGCATLIAVVGAESLWVPWLLASPFVLDATMARRWTTFAMLIGTIPLVAALPWMQVALIATFVWRLREVSSGLIPMQSAAQHHTAGSRHRASCQLALSPVISFLVATVAILVPAAANAFPIQAVESIRPPKGIMTRVTNDGVHRIRTIGQSNDIVSFWHGCASQGRHHSIRTCLAFRGIETASIPGSAALQSDSMWIREYFIVDESLLHSYSAYVTSCFPPFTSRGIHIVFQAPKTSIDHSQFELETQRIAAELFRRHTTEQRKMDISG